MPLLGMLKMYPDSFREHIENHTCEAGVCELGGVPALTAAAD
jgi:hypothetical protein